jgi:hypothetical protein
LEEKRRVAAASDNDQKFLLFLGKFNVPVEIIAPAEWRILDPEGQCNNRHPTWFYRGPDQPHARSLGRSAALSVITGKACRYNILPGCLTALDLWYHMIKSEIFSRILDSAILASILVSLVNVRPRESDFSAGAAHFDEFEKTENRGKLEGNGDTANITIIEIDDFDLALRKQGDGPLP